MGRGSSISEQWKKGTLVLGSGGTQARVWTPMPPGRLLAGARELPFSLILWPDEFQQPSSLIPNVSFLTCPLPSECHHSSQLLALLFVDVNFNPA